MANKRKNRKRSSVKRDDYTKGGRVGYREGDEVEQDRINAIRANRAANRSRGRQEANEIPSPAPAPSAPSPAPASTTPPATTTTTQTATQNNQAQNQQSGEAETIAQPTPSPTPSPFDPGFGNVQPGEYSDEQKPDATGAMKRTTPISMADPATKSAFDIGREYRILRTGAETEKAAQGVVPEAAVIPDAQQVGGMQRDSAGNLILDEEGNPIPVVADSVVTQMAAIPTAQKAGAATVKITGEDSVLQPEVVDTVSETEMGTASGPAEPITAGSFTGDQIGVNAQVDAAQGQISENAIAQAAGVERIEPTQSATIEIKEGALTERVIGTLSEGAKSTAAMNVGSSLSRITRAKKQLANAGLSDADITELGNDPEALEARLADFSEEQRGIIEGLPQEALISNQLDSLLSGIEEGEIPAWARPAVASVESMLAQRGMEASTVGRDALFNAIITSAMPMAQSNAQAIQQSVGQQRTIEAQEAEANAARVQQTALTNASNVFQMDMAQFSSDQQIALSNSKFFTNCRYHRCYNGPTNYYTRCSIDVSG